ncbi:teichoic acids export ABC transporter permease subunit TagG [Staphylococcus simiae]|uniref:Transport permease protein n=1 Tax=Staphylococcus simiae CCM 7213 = CCUG 51256 TaxID=911238 RepID=G5JM61_9STAP|nr:teichoic acids export ABC transporter permease subunit TagG [Staphylococcus simiae]EHJ06708.1 teichoic acid ABC transporter permease protein [Staphylococcus simiae CCM 7213 = CCUG 51256]PNZ11583.1 teichoic acids export ABC transporter permease subunit TagG [Staphylococcus simiae]SNV63207.1 teichoic acid ABC transporter permease protein [Staphylococcus simiae]
MSAVGTVIKEHVKNFYLIQRLAQFQVKILNHSNYLGIAWEIINPAMQIIIYWMVFGLGIRSNAPINGIPFVFWLLVGISMWFFINQGILGGTKAITQKFNQVAKMNFPLSIIPTYMVTSKFYGHIGLLLVIIIVCMFNGIYPTIHIVQLFIFVPFCYFFTASVALFTSTLGVIVRDTQMLMQALLRILFYFSPILWMPKNHGVSGLIHDIMKFNPVYFIAESYRASILFHQWYFIEHWHLMLYNIVVIAVFFILGSILHMKYRDQFADFL